MVTSNQLTRRQMLQGMGVVATGAVLAACAPPVAPDAAGDGGAMETPEVWFAFTNPCPGGGDPERTNAVRDLIFEETGVMVNSNILPPGGAATEKLNLLLASGTQPLDLFVGNWPDFKGVTLPLDDLLEVDGADILAGHSDLDWRMMKDFEGTIWGYPRLGLMGHTHFPFFRSDWLAEAGLDLPDTWDGMEEAYLAMRGNNPEAIITTMGRRHLMYNTLGAFTDHGYSRWVDPADNMLKPPELQEGYPDWLAKMNQWWEDGWLQQESFANPDYRSMLKTLTIGLWLGWYSRITGWWSDIRRDAGYVEEDYVPSLKIVGPSGIAKTNNAGSNNAYMIGRKSKHPDAVIKYVDWIYSGGPDDVTNYLIASWGIPGEDWEWVDKTEKIARQFSAGSSVCEEKYSRDYQITLGLGPETWATAVKIEQDDGSIFWNRHWKHINTYWNQYDGGRMPVDFDVPYDRTAIRDSFPGEVDLERFLDEESIKFISGARPLSEWSSFVDDLNGAGLDRWSELYTEQYRLYHP
jgi:ABC-type glycerol-3-phosphate transport system substrate-binding protein